MAGSTKSGFHCVLGVFFTPVVRFFSITTWVSLNFLQFPSLRSALHSLSVYLALTSLTSCPLFLSHVSYKKIALSSFQLYSCTLCSMIVTIFFSFYSHTRCFLLCCGPLSSVALPSTFIFLLSFFHPPLLRHSIILFICSAFSDIYNFPLSSSSQSATWGCCRLCLILTWHRKLCVWLLVLAWLGSDLLGLKTVLCTHLAPEGRSASQLLSVDSFCRY